MTPKTQGPLAGIRIVELGGIGPGPFAALLLADLGAEIVRIDRIVASDSGIAVDEKYNLLNRSRRSIAMDLKHPQAVAAVLRMLEQADALIEGFRPGVTERLGLGPENCLARNPRLVYGRMTGWGQDGTLAEAPGHDLSPGRPAGHRSVPAGTSSRPGPARRCRTPGSPNTDSA